MHFLDLAPEARLHFQTTSRNLDPRGAPAMSLEVRQRADGSFAYRVQFRPIPGGSPTTETFETEAGALAFEALVKRVGGAAAQAQRDARTAAQPEGVTLATWAETYFDGLSGITGGTRKAYKAKARRTWLSRLGALPVRAITTDDVRGWVQWQEAQSSYRAKPDAPKLMAAKTVEDARSLLAQVLEAAVEKDLADRNAARGVKVSKGLQEEMVFLTPREFGLLLRHVPDHYRPLVAFLYATGLRWGEATALTWGAVDLKVDIPTCRVFQGWEDVRSGPRKIGAPKTRRSLRTVSLPDSLLPMLGTPGSPNAFVFRTGGQRAGAVITHSSFYRDVWTPLVRSINDPAACAALGHAPIGKSPRIHDLRHSHASALIAQGVDLLTIQRRLGHESIKTTVDRYGHLAPDAHQVGATAAESALAAALRVG